MGFLLLSDAPSAPVIPATGPNGVIWPYLAERAVKTTMRFATSVVRAHDGTERRAASATKPFEEYALSYLLDDEQAREQRARLFVDPTALRLVPLAQHQLIALAPVTGVTVVVTSTALWDFTAQGQRVLIVNEVTRTAYQAVIQLTSSTSITLDVSPPVGQDYPAGVTSIMPLMACWLDQPVPTGRWAVSLSKIEARARRARVDPALGTGAAALATFDGLTLLDRAPLHRDMGQEQTDGDSETINYGSIAESYFSASAAPIQRAHMFLVQTDAERQYWRSFLSFTRGRQKAFLMATWRPDFLVQNLRSGNQLTVRSNRYSLYYGVSFLAGTRVQLEYENGTLDRRVIDTVVDEGTDPPTESFYLSGSQLPFTPIKVSLLEKVRLASDEVSWDFDDGGSAVKIVVVNCLA